MVYQHDRRASTGFFGICHLILFFLLGFPAKGLAQENGPWIRFTDPHTYLCGFKDLQGNIKIPATLEESYLPDTFYHIMPVQQKKDDHYIFYYLLKNGGTVGRDSAYFDNEVNCESEGTIQYRDSASSKFGFFNQDGQVIIPAMYNFATPFRGGISFAYKNGRKKCFSGDPDDTLSCESLGYGAGDFVMINQRNEVLADSIMVDVSELDPYTAMENTAVDMGVYVRIKGTGGRVFSLMDYRKKLLRWMTTELTDAINSGDTLRMKNIFLPLVETWSAEKGWSNVSRESFLKNFPRRFAPSKFQETDRKKIKVTEEEPDMQYPGTRNWLNACGHYQKERYPIYSVEIIYYKRTQGIIDGKPSPQDEDHNRDHAEAFSCVWTGQTFQILSASLTGADGISAKTGR